MHVASGPHVTALIELNRMCPALFYLFIDTFGYTKLSAFQASMHVTMLEN